MIETVTNKNTLLLCTGSIKMVTRNYNAKIASRCGIYYVHQLQLIECGGPENAGRGRKNPRLLLLL